MEVIIPEEVFIDFCYTSYFVDVYFQEQVYNINY